MDLPLGLKWVEVDRPEVLDCKEEFLRTERSVCELEPIRLDLADARARRALFESLYTISAKGLVLSEGLLIYFIPAEVAVFPSSSPPMSPAPSDYSHDTQPEILAWVDSFQP